MDFRFWKRVGVFTILLSCSFATAQAAEVKTDSAKPSIPKFYCYQTKGSVNQRFQAGFSTCKGADGKDEVLPKEEVCLESAFCSPGTDQFKADIQYENLRVNKGAAKPFDQLEPLEIAEFMNVATDRSHGRVAAASSLLSCGAKNGVCPPAALCQADSLFYDFQDNQNAIFNLPISYPPTSTTK